MPYIAIQCYPKDDVTKRKVVDKINQIFLEEWGCPQEAITISLEEVSPADWTEKVRIPEINGNLDKMMVLDGQKKY